MPTAKKVNSELILMLIAIVDWTYDTKEIVEVMRHVLLRIPFSARYGIADLQHCSAGVWHVASRLKVGSRVNP